jgi:hypothetical protein
MADPVVDYLHVRHPHPRYLETEAAFLYELQAWADTIDNQLIELADLAEQGLKVHGVDVLQRRRNQLFEIEEMLKVIHRPPDDDGL